MTNETENKVDFAFRADKNEKIFFSSMEEVMLNSETLTPIHIKGAKTIDKYGVAVSSEEGDDEFFWFDSLEEAQNFSDEMRVKGHLEF